MLRIILGDEHFSKDIVKLFISFDEKLIFIIVNNKIDIIDVDNNGNFEVEVNTDYIPGNLCFKIDWISGQIYQEEPEGKFKEISAEFCEII